MGEEREKVARKANEEPDVEAHVAKKKANEEPDSENDEDTPDVEAHKFHRK